MKKRLFPDKQQSAGARNLFTPSAKIFRLALICGHLIFVSRPGSHMQQQQRRWRCCSPQTWWRDQDLLIISFLSQLDLWKWNLLVRKTVNVHIRSFSHTRSLLHNSISNVGPPGGKISTMCEFRSDASLKNENCCLLGGWKTGVMCRESKTLFWSMSNRIKKSNFTKVLKVFSLMDRPSQPSRLETYGF